MKLTKSKLKEIIREELVSEGLKKYKGVFDYSPDDPTWAQASFVELFDESPEYSESWDAFGWNNYNNHQKAVDELHREMFKIIDNYVVVKKSAKSIYKVKDRIFKKWRKADGSKSGD